MICYTPTRTEKKTDLLRSSKQNGRNKATTIGIPLDNRRKKKKTVMNIGTKVLIKKLVDEEIQIDKCWRVECGIRCC